MFQYATEEQAERARDGLHNVKWPSSNDDSLKVEFVTEERVGPGKGSAKISRLQLIRRREDMKEKPKEELGGLRVMVDNDVSTMSLTCR